MARTHDETTRMSASVDQLLTLVRLDAHQPLARGAVDLAAVYAEVVAATSLTAASGR